MLYKEIMSDKRIFPKLNLNGYPIFNKVGLVVGHDWFLITFLYGFFLVVRSKIYNLA
ncbi:hypothetical protein SSTU70S_05615 [Stutzerimonas stutzeri]